MDFTLNLNFIAFGAYDPVLLAELRTKGKMIVHTKNGAYFSGYFLKDDEFLDARYGFIDDISGLWFDPDALANYALLPEPEPDPDD